MIEQSQIAMADELDNLANRIDHLNLRQTAAHAAQVARRLDSASAMFLH
ncbi:MAG: hypothetical protein QGD91_09895 [Actinomycetota bacterium]|nr:hypothetical protein [Actinomycetota bacterium]